METLINIISFIILIGLISVPILLFVGIKKWYHRKFDFIIFLISGLILTAGIMLTFAWWDDKSSEILLKHYNGLSFNDDFGTYQYSIENVKTENLERVEQLKIKYFGIGWPLKAIMSFVFYSPYLLIIYGVGQLIRRMKRKNKEHAPNTVYSK